MISDPSHRPVSALRQRMIRALIATLTYSFRAHHRRPEDEGRGPPAARRRLDNPAA
jgi:hypothetical protein